MTRKLINSNKFFLIIWFFLFAKTLNCWSWEEIFKLIRWVLLNLLKTFEFPTFFFANIYGRDRTHEEIYAETLIFTLSYGGWSGSVFTCKWLCWNDFFLQVEEKPFFPCIDFHKSLYHARRFKIQYWPNEFLGSFFFFFLLFLYGRDTKSLQ